MSTNQFCMYPNFWSAAAILKYANRAAFPTTAANGTIALALDTDYLYAFNSTSGTWVQIGAQVGGDTVNFSVWQSPQQTIPNNVVTKITLNVKNFDTGTYWNTSNSRYTPLLSGKYIFSFQGAWVAPGSANTTVQFFIYKNGVVIAQTLAYTVSLGTFANIPPLTAIIDMNGSTDYIECYAWANGNSGLGLAIANDPTMTFFSGALINQVGSPAVSPVIPRQLVYSLSGSDIDGNGTWDSPFKTPQAALNQALLMSPTYSQPVVIYGDAGAYAINTSQMMYPNVYWDGVPNAVTFVAGTSSTFGLGPNSAFTTSVSNICISNISFDPSLSFSFDTTGITNFNCDLFIKDTNIQGNAVFRLSSNLHSSQVYCLDNVDIASANSKGLTVDSIAFFARGAHTLSAGAGSYISLLSPNNYLNFLSTGNNGLGSISNTSSSSYSQTISILAGKQVTFSTLDATLAGGVNVTVDATTKMTAGPVFNGTNYVYVDQTFHNDHFPAILTDAASINWDLGLYPSAQWTISGNHSIDISSALKGGIYNLTIIQGGVGNFTPTFSAAFNFPLGQPILQTLAGAYTSYIFYCYDGNNLTCINPRMLQTSTVTAVGSRAALNLTTASTQNATLLGEEAGAVIPSSPTNPGNVTLIGYQAGIAYTTSGSANDGHVAIGHQALSTTATSAANTAIGFQALQKLTTSPSNVAIGWGAGVQLTSGTGQNVLVGLFAGSGATGQTIANNVMIGYHAGWNVTTASTNVIIGATSAPTLGSGTNNVVIGQGADVSGAAGTNQIVIGQGVTGVGSNIAVIGNSSISNLVSASTTGGCALGSSANPYGFLYIGTAVNYVAIDTATQTTNGVTLAIPDAGGQPQNFALTSVTATAVNTNACKWITYFANSSSLITITLPSTIAQGDRFEVIGQGTGGWKINYGTGVSIKLNANLSTTTSTGYLSSTDQYDSIKLIAESSTVLVVEYCKGNFVTDTGSVFNAVNAVSPINTVFFNTSAKTLSISDAGTFQNCSSSSAQTITVPQSSSVPWTLGTKIEIFQQNTGQVAVAAGTGVTIQSKAGNLKLAAQYSGATLTYLGGNVWVLIGDLSA